jgi:hypothetical protein
MNERGGRPSGGFAAAIAFLLVAVGYVAVMVAMWKH